MGNVGRFFCVALPFILTAASIVCMLIAGLAGVVSNNNLYIFQVNTTGLSINPVTLASVLDISKRSPGSVTWHAKELLDGTGTTGSKKEGSSSGSGSSSSSSSSSTNLTAADLSLADLYDINLWGYCYTPQSGSRTCTKAKFDWAATYLNTSSLTSTTGTNVTLPSTVTNALNVFKAVAKWTEVVYIVAMVALGLELLFGLFTSCSRVVSCITWLISGLASTFVVGAAAMMTAMAAVVIGTVESTAKFYGVKGSFNTSFLAVIWLGAAFAIAAGMFWLFTVCCCKPDHRSSKRSRGGAEGEKFLPTGAYAPLHDGNGTHSGHSYNPAYGAPRHQQGGRSDLAYEPYSHSNV